MPDEPKTLSAAAAPLIELLRRIPKNVAHSKVTGRGADIVFQNIPCGRLCHEAADRIEEQQEWIAALRAEVERLRKALTTYGDHKESCRFLDTRSLDLEPFPCNCGWKQEDPDA
jgi:hypothetical protein